MEFYNNKITLQSEILRPEFGWCNSDDAFECFREVIGTAESEFRRNLGNRHGAFNQVYRCFIYLHLDKVVNRGTSDFTDEIPVEIRTAITRIISQLLQSQCFFDVFRHIMGNSANHRLRLSRSLGLLLSEQVCIKIRCHEVRKRMLA